MAEHEAEPLAAQVSELQARLAGLEGRVAALEARPGARTHARAESEVEEGAALPSLPAGAAALAGRTLLVLAGAYLFRALTDAGALAPPAGALLGLAYAGFWLARADRDGGAGRRASAFLHGAASAAVALPLAFEAAARFGWLSPRGAGALIAAFTGAGLLVAYRRGLPANAWVATLAGCAAVASLLAATHDPLAAVATLLALAALVEWLAFRDAWLGLRWCTAIAVDLAAALLLLVAARPVVPAGYPPIEPLHAAAALVGLPVLFVASIGARTLRRGCPVRLFEVVQGATAVGLGLLAARLVLEAHGASTPWPALVAAALAVLCYAVAFAHVERRPGAGRNFYFYSAAGGLLTLGATLELGSAAARPLAWTALGAAAALLGRRFDRTTLRAHGAAYLALAALAAGLVSSGVLALAGIAGGSPRPAAWGAAAGAAVGWAALAGERSDRPSSSRLPRLALALVVALAFAAAGRHALDMAALPADARAFVGSALVAALALAAAWLARRGQPELAWLAYPLTALLGARLLLLDLPAGRPAASVLSLGLCGALLVVLPRLLRAGERTG